MPEAKQEELEKAEDFVISVLTNEPSEPRELAKYKIYLVFKRPTMAEKFRQRGWTSRKLREFELSEDDDPQLLFFFRYWGTLNSYVDRIYVEDSSGPVKIAGKKYSEYAFDGKTDLDYKSLFEKYVMEEIYNKGLSEEAFVSEVILLHAGWINETTRVSEDDIKNS